MVQQAHMAQSNMSFLASRPAMPVMAHLAVAFAVLITKWSQRQHTRKHLRHLTVQQLDDVGLSPFEAHNQANLPFWRP